MGLADFIEVLGVRNHFLAVLLGLPRLYLLLTIPPMFGGQQLLTGQMKAAVLFAFYLVLHPVVLGQVPAGADFSAAWLAVYAGLAVKEIGLGFLMGFIAGLVFWAVQSAGFLMDNQRGASMAQGTDPLSGEEASPLASFLFQFLVCLFFMTGAFVGFLSLFYQSYLLWPVFAWLPEITVQLPLFFGSLVNWLMVSAVLLAGPVVVASLLTDLALGLINRFASQLNVYILAMPIKSGLTMFIVLIFLGVLARQAPELFGELTRALTGLYDLWRR